MGAAIKLNEEDTWFSFEALIRSKLVLIRPVDASGIAERIYLHPLVQEFAHELLKTSSDIGEDVLYEALAVHYTEWIQDKSEDILTEEDVNLMFALRWAKAHIAQAGTILARLIYSLRWYWQNQFQIEEAFEWLDAPVVRVASIDTPVPYSPPLEDYYLPQVKDVVEAARKLAAY